MKWVTQRTPEVSAAIAGMGLHKVVSHLLASLGMSQTEEAEAFLNPRLRQLEDPFAMTGMEQAVARIEQALREDERIVIVGDYDVDGVTSTTLLVDVLQRLGAKPDYIVPRRLEEGYGLSSAAVERVMVDYSPQLLLVLDCGTNSVDEVAYLKERGVDVVIVDHHQLKDGPTPECTLINPHVHDRPEAPWFHCCTVGLVFKLAHALLKSLRQQDVEKAHALDPKRWLDLVAMGTIADMVPLLGENRTFVRHGLESLRTSGRQGLRALLEVSGVDLSGPLKPSDISFRVGPRINASGRLADAALPVAMLLEEDYAHCIHAAKELETLNRERQGIERAMVGEAERLIAGDESYANAVVLYQPDWHPGVVGIVAGKLSRDLNRPCIVLGREGNLAKGSGRSIHGVNLVEALSRCAEQLTSWGGHPMAAGVALEYERVEVFRRCFTEAVCAQLSGSIPEPELEIALWLDVGDLSASLLDLMECLHPYGQQNPQPVFGLRGVRLSGRPQVFGKKHLRFNLHGTQGKFQVLAWNMANRIPPCDTSLELACRLGWNYWNGRRIAQADLLDWRVAS